MSDRVSFECSTPQHLNEFVFEFNPVDADINPKRELIESSESIDSKLMELFSYKGETDYDGGYTWNKSRLATMLRGSCQWERYLKSLNITLVQLEKLFNLIQKFLDFRQLRTDFLVNGSTNAKFEGSKFESKEMEYELDKVISQFIHEFSTTG
ncbi:hypothetical protein GCK72_000856 [Caenorhabditis remanei]|uniref:Uncharacterized protein n=1 Tax=Caenorhabditis remanei TaxID=31234 RepID=A0A6A5HS51_CAERE|nr:hypothetical protein GCK72_000856 [Caenorhabditis remanei]KAF1769043.1 hypothetical protein GCK72_000856 [Caenorhabditis remanei]